MGVIENPGEVTSIVWADYMSCSRCEMKSVCTLTKVNVGLSLQHQCACRFLRKEGAGFDYLIKEALLASGKLRPVVEVRFRLGERLHFHLYAPQWRNRPGRPPYPAHIAVLGEKRSCLQVISSSEDIMAVAVEAGRIESRFYP